VKALGAVMIIAAASVWGILGAMRLSARVKSLTTLIAGLNFMQSEMMTRLTPLPEVCRKAAQNAREPAKTLFQNVCAGLKSLGERQFSDIWRDAVDSTPELLLTEPERDALHELGSGLGRYGIDQQVALFEQVRKRLEDLLKSAESDREKNSRVYVSFGAAAGLFLVLILI